MKRRYLGEAALVAAVAAFQLVGTLLAARHQDAARNLDLGSTLLLLAGPLALPLRRRAPWLAVGVALLAAVSYFSIGYPGGPAFASVVISLIGVYRGRVIQARALRHQQEAQRRDQERLLIAQELHDVLAHSTAVVSVQVGVALHLMDTHPEQVRASLEAIREASAESLRELRAAVELLRADPPGGQTAQPAQNAAPGLARLDTLLASARTAGVTVRCETVGDPRPLSPELDLAAYRIIQESLTNAARHAGPGQARLRLRYGTSELLVRLDTGGRRDHSRRLATEPVTEVPGAGRGLVGMRERALSLGGTLLAEPTADGGFEVVAELPYRRIP